MQISLLDFFSLTDSESTCLSTVEKTLISVARHLLGRNSRSGPTVLDVELNNNAGWRGHCKVLIQGCLLFFYYVMQLTPYPRAHQQDQSMLVIEQNSHWIIWLSFYLLVEKWAGKTFEWVGTLLFIIIKQQQPKGLFLSNVKKQILKSQCVFQS